MGVHAKKILFIFQILFTCGLLLWVLLGINWVLFFDILLHVRVLTVFYGFCFVLLSFAAQGIRLSLLLDAKGIRRGMLRTTVIYWLGSFHDLYFPANIGGDTFRTMRLKQERSVGTLASAILSLRIQGFLGLSILASFGYACLLFSPYWVMLVAVSFVFVTGSFFYFSRPFISRYLSVNCSQSAIKSRFSKVLASLLVFAKGKQVLGKTFLVYFLFVGSSCVIYYFAFSAFGLKIPFRELLVYIPVIMFASMLPISIQGRGVVEWLLCLFWDGRFGPKEQIVAASLLVYFLFIANGVVAGIVGVFLKKK